MGRELRDTEFKKWLEIWDFESSERESVARWLNAVCYLRI